MEKYIIYIAIAVVIPVLGYIIKNFNYFKAQKQQIESSKSNIEIALTKRFDAITKINKTVSAYAGHEATTLANVVQLRKGMSTKEMNEASEQMDKAYSNLAVLVENYPDLKANVNFLNLQTTIDDIETEIQANRRMYNRDVKEYNSRVQSFPSNLVAKISNARLESYFEAEAHKLQDVELRF